MDIDLTKMLEEYEKAYLLEAKTLLGNQYDYLKDALIHYFINEMSELAAYDYLNQMESVYKQGKDNICRKDPDFDSMIHAGNLICLSTRAAVVYELLSKGRKIYHYYPYFDNMGYFELDFDPVKLWEQVRFGHVVSSRFHGPYEICAYEIDINNPEFQRYRKLLYQNTIKQICENYADFVYVTATHKMQKDIRTHLNYIQSMYQYDY